MRMPTRYPRPDGRWAVRTINLKGSTRIGPIPVRWVVTGDRSSAGASWFGVHSAVAPRSSVSSDASRAAAPWVSCRHASMDGLRTRRPASDVSIVEVALFLVLAVLVASLSIAVLA